MNIFNINPFVRFASSFKLISVPKEKRGYDCRIIYVESGTIKIIIDNKTFTLKKDSLFFCPAGFKYALANSEEETFIKALNFDFTTQHSDITAQMDPLESNEFNESKAIKPQFISDSKILNSYYILENAKVFENKISKIIKEFSYGKLLFREKAGAILKEILIDLHRTESTQSHNASLAINIAIEFISQNYSDKIDNKTISNLTNYHEYHLNRLFVKHTGISLHKYIMRFRLDKAKELLLNSNLSFNSIAEQTGFSNASHFSYFFKKEFNMTPSTYRNKFTI